jgi:hypothetical protein
LAICFGEKVMTDTVVLLVALVLGGLILLGLGNGSRH